MSKDTRRERPVNSFVAEKIGEKVYQYKGQTLQLVGHWRSKRLRLKKITGNDVDLYYVPAIAAIAYMYDNDDVRFVLTAPLWEQAKWVRIFKSHKISLVDRAWLKLHNYQVFE